MTAIRALALACVLVTAFYTQSKSGEVWKCSMKAPLPKYPNIDYDLDILDKAQNANVFWQKPGQFIFWAVPGSDILESFRISENSPAMLRAALDVERSLHEELTLDKRSGKIRIKGGRVVGEVRHIQEGSCIPPRH